MTMINSWRSFITEQINIDELVDPETIDVSSFKIQESLNEDFWVGPDLKLKPDVRERLLEIVNDFWADLELDYVDIIDIIFTGSLSNYNWSVFSDVDLHIVIDFDQIAGKEEVIREFFLAKKSLWNRTHEITIFGFEVELYVQDNDEPHEATAIYSVLNDEWNVKATRVDPIIDWRSVKGKAAGMIDQIIKVAELYEDEDYEEAHKYATKLKNKIRRFRKSGLETGGEYSTENLAFKVLRRSDNLQRLSYLHADSYDRMMSLHQS